MGARRWCMDGADAVRRGALRRLRLFAVGTAVAILLSGSMTDTRRAWAVPEGHGKQVEDSSREGERHRSGPQRPVRQPSSGGAPLRSGHVWPVARPGTGRARPEVRRGWEPPPSPWASGHRGVDLAAERGRQVRSVGNGRVSFSGEVAGRGVLSIELSGTGDPPIRTTYEPVRPSVHKGEKVRAGQVVATVADGAFHCQGSCLHWGARRGDRYLDPLSLLPPGLLRSGPARLLPFYGVPVPGGQEATADRRGPRTTATGRVSTAGSSPPEAVSNVAAARPIGIGGAVLTLTLAGAALLARRRLSHPRHATSVRRPP